MKKISKIKIAVVTTGILGLAIAYGAFRLNGGWNTNTTRAEFEEVVESTNLDTRGAAYYRGRKDGYDYFRATWNVGAKNMKVPVSESPVTESFPYTTDESQWQGELHGFERNGLVSRPRSEVECKAGRNSY